MLYDRATHGLHQHAGGLCDGLRVLRDGAERTCAQPDSGEIVAQVLAAARYLASAAASPGCLAAPAAAHDASFIPLSAFGSLGSLEPYSPSFRAKTVPSAASCLNG